MDYSWTGDVDLLIRRPLTQQLSVFVHGRGELYGVDHAIASRTAQRGGVAEAGVRLRGRAGAVELFAGAEQRVDADPLTWEPRRWALAGFRLVSR